MVSRVVLNRRISRTPPRSVTALGYAAFFMLGWSSVLVPTLVDSIETAFSRTDSGIAAVYLVGAAVYATGAVIGGLIAERVGPRAVLSGAIALLGAGLIAQAWPPVWPLFLVAIGVGKSGGGAIEEGVQGLVLQIRTDVTGGALNLLHLFFGLGSLSGPLAATFSIHAGLSWNALFAIVGAMFFTLAIAIATMPGFPPAQRLEKEANRDAPDLSAEASLRPFVWVALAMGLYEAAALGTTSWMVRFFAGSSVELGAGALSLFWAGVSLSRIAAQWTTRLLAPHLFTITCVALMLASILGAVLVPWPIVSVAFFGVTELVVGPIYPMMMAIGGELYPTRSARISGGLSASATIGAIIYPPLVGFAAAGAGIRIGFVGAAALGIPTMLAISFARPSGAH